MSRKMQLIAAGAALVVTVGVGVGIAAASRGGSASGSTGSAQLAAGHGDKSSVPLVHPKGYVALVFVGGTDSNVTWQVLAALDKRHSVASFSVAYPKDRSGLNLVVREGREGMTVCEPSDVSGLKVIDTQDASGASPDDQVANGLVGVKAGSIIQMHDGSVDGYVATPASGLATATAAAGLIRELRARNLEPGVLDGCTARVVAGRYTGK